MSAENTQGVCRCCGEPFADDRPKSGGPGWMCVPCATGITLPDAPPQPVAEPVRFPKGRWLSVVLLFLALSASGAVSEAFLDRLETIESGGDATAIGDAGRSRGPYQLTARAWRDVNRVRAKQGITLWPYSAAHNRPVARAYAREYLKISEDRFIAATGRTPSPGQLYASWNLGHEGFRRRAFNLSNCPPATRQAAAWISRTE